MKSSNRQSIDRMPIVNLAIRDVEWELIAVGPFRVGHFTGTLITFVIVAFVIYVLVKATKKWGIE